MRNQRRRLIASSCLLAAVVLATVIARPRAAAADREFTQAERQFWSLQKIATAAPPAVTNALA